LLNNYAKIRVEPGFRSIFYKRNLSICEFGAKPSFLDNKKDR